MLFAFFSGKPDFHGIPLDYHWLKLFCPVVVIGHPLKAVTGQRFQSTGQRVLSYAGGLFMREAGLKLKVAMVAICLVNFRLCSSLTVVDRLWLSVNS